MQILNSIYLIIFLVCVLIIVVFFTFSSIKKLTAFRSFSFSPFLLIAPGIIDVHNTSVIKSLMVTIFIMTAFLFACVLILRFRYSYDYFNFLAGVCLVIDGSLLIPSWFALNNNMSPVAERVGKRFLDNINSLIIRQTTQDLNAGAINEWTCMDSIDVWFTYALLFVTPLLIFLIILGFGSLLHELRDPVAFSMFSILGLLLFYWLPTTALPYAIDISQAIGDYLDNANVTLLCVAWQQRFARGAFILFILLLHSITFLDLALEVNNPKVVNFLATLRYNIGLHTAKRRVVLSLIIVYIIFIWGQIDTWYFILSDVFAYFILGLWSLWSYLSATPIIFRLVDLNGEIKEYVSFKRGITKTGNRSGVKSTVNGTRVSWPSPKLVGDPSHQPKSSFQQYTKKFIVMAEQDIIIPKSRFEKYEQSRSWAYFSMRDQTRGSKNWVRDC